VGRGVFEVGGGVCAREDEGHGERSKKRDVQGRKPYVSSGGKEGRIAKRVERCDFSSEKSKGRGRECERIQYSYFGKKKACWEKCHSLRDLLLVAVLEAALRCFNKKTRVGMHENEKGGETEVDSA